MTYRESEINKIASELLEKYQSYKVWCFFGEMGAGKTTLIKALCQAMEVTDSLSSPSFSIVNEYQTCSDETLYHFDFYRIRSTEEAEDIGVTEYFDSGKMCLIEWPERVETLLPDVYLQINIKLVGDFTRELMIVSHG